MLRTRSRLGTLRAGGAIGFVVAIAASLVLVAGAPGAFARAAAATAARPECAQALTPGDSQITIDSGGMQRTATLHIPLARAGMRLPLLVALHGAGQNASFFEPYTGFSQIADGEGFIVVYPNAAGSHSFWNINDHEPKAADDVAFIGALLDRVERNYCVDLRRVYATGVSNGGGMASRLGCQLSSRFAAIAPVAGGYRSLPACHPGAPVSVLEVHGTNDGAVPYYGEPGDHAGAVPAFLQGWIAHDHCARTAARHREAAQVLLFKWSKCAGGTAVEHLEIIGGTHQLPGAMPPDYGPRSTVSVPWLVWSFLRSHQRAPQAPKATPTPPAAGVTAPAPAPPATAAAARFAFAAQASAAPCAAATPAGSQTIALSVDHVSRTVVLHIPAAPAGARLPLLLAYHGFGGSGVMMERETGLSALADARGFIVAYPEGLGGRWGTHSGPRSEQDLDMTRATLDYIEAHYCTNPARVFATGVSNGGSMAVHVACELSERFVAVAIVAGDYRAADPCAPERPVSMLVIHAINDTVVPYGGFPHVGGVFWFLNLWIGLDRCSTSTSRARLAQHMVELGWACPASHTRVAHVRLYRGGHGWPGADPPPGTLPSATSASSLLWKFFSSLPARTGDAASPFQPRPASAPSHAPAAGGAPAAPASA